LGDEVLHGSFGLVGLVQQGDDAVLARLQQPFRRHGKLKPFVTRCHALLLPHGRRRL
jgi:hypothetical protein